jgi:FMN-dependent NADH-azoreductase
MYVRTHIIVAAEGRIWSLDMPSLLHISASPRGERSESLAIAGTFLDTLRDSRPDITVETFDLWDGSLPPFGPAAASAKMSVFAGQEPTGEDAAAWRAAERTFRRFARADYYLFSVPMWNHGIPYVLKQFIDVVSQPGMVFSFDPQDGYTGLLTGRRAVVVYTSAVYGPGRPPEFGTDFQAPYLVSWLAWAGVADVSEVSFRPNLATPDAGLGRDAAHAAARDLAKTF